jgi:hypothetical protein
LDMPSKPSVLPGKKGLSSPPPFYAVQVEPAYALWRGPVQRPGHL